MAPVPEDDVSTAKTKFADAVSTPPPAQTKPLLDPWLVLRLGGKKPESPQDDKPETKTERPLSPFEAAVTGQKPDATRPDTSQPAQSGELQLVQVERPDLVPVAMDDYSVPVENADPKLVSFLKETAYAEGMTRKQVANLAVKYQNLVNKEMAEQRRAAEETFKSVTSELQGAWGADFDTNSKAVQEFTKGLSDAQFNALVHRLLHEEAKRRRG
jgi:hypothetical protein